MSARTPSMPMKDETLFDSQPQLSDDAQDDDNDDDDNAAVDAETIVDKEDPLLLAIDDLEGRVVAALDDVKLHPGVRTNTAAGVNVHDELGMLMRPVLEVAAHTAPSIARTYYQGVGAEGIEVSVEDVYERVVSDLVLPVILEIAQSDTSPAKRGASLDFFRLLWIECRKAGSWLDETATGMQAGPYGPGGAAAPAVPMTPMIHAVLKRRNAKRLVREGEMLRYWVEASSACLQPGAFSNEDSEGAVASRGIIAASASLRPSLTHIAVRIKDADDRGANRLYTPVMKMIEGVMKKLFLSSPIESVLSACIKFLEIVILCCSFMPQDAVAQRRRGQTTTSLFSLDDLPAGHPVITRESLESIADYAFTTLRGLTLCGGQLKIDVNVLSDMMLTSGGDGSASAQIVSILKPAALAYLEVESTLPRPDDGDALKYELDLASFEYDFRLAQKSYILTVNAMATLASNRPLFFRDASVCLARKTVNAPVFVDEGPLTRPAILAVTQALKASCLTLLRNSLSVTTNSFDVLQEALKTVDMGVQAEKALAMARQATALKTAGRAARNRANMYYEWEAGESGRQTKRQRETDDALARMRAAKVARGLGQGIQLPTSMADAIDLVLLNLGSLPSTCPAKSTKEESRSVPVTLDFIVDAILTNGASLSQEKGRWYERDGGMSFSLDLASDQKFTIGSVHAQVMAQVDEGEGEESGAQDRRQRFLSQCSIAAAAASSRILTASSSYQSKTLAEYRYQLSARLAFTLKGVLPTGHLLSSLELAREAAESCDKLLDEGWKGALAEFVLAYPLAASGLSLCATARTEDDIADNDTVEHSVAVCILNEAFLQSSKTLGASFTLYELSLGLYVAAVVAAGQSSANKPNDISRRKAAARSINELQRDVNKLPRLTSEALRLVGAFCDIGEITKRASDASRKSMHETVASTAAFHAAKVAAEKRATTALLIFRDVAFQRDDEDTRKAAVGCAASVASGRIPSVTSVQENAMKLLMNLLFTRSDVLASDVVDAVTVEFRYFSDLARGSFDLVTKANQASAKDERQSTNQLAPQSEEEKHLMDRLKHPIMLFMALCVRRPDLIGTLFEASSVEKANVLSRSVRSSMSTLAWATSAKHGAAAITLQVASMCGPKETPLLLSFLENVVSNIGDHTTEDEVAELCVKIQDQKANEAGDKDPRFIIPIVSVMKRQLLLGRLPEFVAADDIVFLAALVRMCDRQQRNALIFRDEPDDANPTLRGMTYCEQLVYLHQLDFVLCRIPQKRYLAAIKLCLEDDAVFTDRVVMSALEYMSGKFLAGTDRLPLAFMRTVILTCTKHESLQSWIANVLLTRLVEGKIYEDPRQWEGWMRCAHMLQKSDDPAANSIEAIDKLPADQLIQYQRKWAGT